MSDEPYVNWDVAPEGCNAVYSPYLREDGVASHDGWEKWVQHGNFGIDVYEWQDFWELVPSDGNWNLDPDLRIFRPKEEIVSAKERNEVKDYSKMPEGTRIPDTVDMYQVHAYIRENLTLNIENTVRSGNCYESKLQLLLAGEVISEIEI